MRVKQRFTEQLKQVEIVPIEVEPSSQEEQAALDDPPWAQFAGMYENNPLFDEVLDSIQTYRQALDADDSVI